MSHYLEKISQDLENRLGRPFGTFKVKPEFLAKKAEQWIEEHSLEGAPHPTMAGFAFYLGVARRTLIGYRHKDEFREALDRISGFVEMKTAQACFDPNIRSGGPIFLLKANFGYKDRSELGVNVNLNWSEVLRQAKEQREGIIDVEPTGEDSAKLD